MDFIFTLIGISFVLALFDLARRWLFSASDLDDLGGSD
jgi:hypothetical protein